MPIFLSRHLVKRCHAQLRGKDWPRVHQPEQIDAVLRLAAPQRYDHFIKKVAGWRKVWGLYDDGWAMSGTDAGEPIFPCWPEREYAELCASEDWPSMSKQLKPIAYLNAEGGPLLLLDARAATSWRGADAGSKDYENLCATFDAQPDLEGYETVIGAQRAVAWEMVGGGTADVFQLGGGQLRVVRAWVEEDTLEELEQLALADATTRVAIGDIDVPSGLLAVLWAPESGEPVPADISGDHESVEGTAMDNSAVVLKVAHRRYRCWHDTVSINASSARRLTLMPG